MKAQIAPYKYPRAIEFVTALPRTQTGKLQRFKLREPEEAADDDPTAARLAAARGLLPAAISAQGATVFVSGQMGWDGQGRFVSNDFVPQVRQALGNVVAVSPKGAPGPSTSSG